eukprot:COSAG04_NODE_353_length_16071_cov_8.722514_4_plen_136_part_00
MFGTHAQAQRDAEAKAKQSQREKDRMARDAKIAAEKAAQAQKLAVEQAAREKKVEMEKQLHQQQLGTEPSIIEGQPALFFLGHISPIFAPFFLVLSRFSPSDARIPESGTKRPGGGSVTVQNGRQKSGRRRSLEE